MEIIFHLANKLADKINISPAASRGLIKLAIKDEFGPFKPLNQLNFSDFKNILLHSLQNRLIELDVKDAKKIVDFLVLELTTHQSLITIGGV